MTMTDIDEITFPTSVCPKREAGEVHESHHIAGTWRQPCPGVAAPVKITRRKRPMSGDFKWYIEMDARVYGPYDTKADATVIAKS